MPVASIVLHMVRLFVSKFGRDAALAHMVPGDRFLLSLEHLYGFRGAEVHVVGRMPSWLTLSDVSRHGATAVWHSELGDAESGCQTCAAWKVPA